MGLEQNWFGGEENFKSFRGLSDYSFGGATPTLKHWKLTGNLGGEKFVDWARGGYNEGGLFAVRKGYHLPGFDDSKWASKSPLKGISGPGVEFYRTTFSLNIPDGVDYPISIDFGNEVKESYRVEIYVNVSTIFDLKIRWSFSNGLTIGMAVWQVYRRYWSSDVVPNS